MARTNQVLQAPWEEFKPEERVWVIPAARMRKGKREHRVALSARAMAVLEQQAAIRVNDYVFAGPRRGGYADKKLLDQVLKRSVAAT